MTTELIGLKPGLNTFHRDVRDKDGKLVDLLKFEPGITHDLNDEELEAVANDIGNTLGCVTLDKNGRPRYDADLTHKIVVGIATDRLQHRIQLKPHQAAAMEVDANQKKSEAKQPAPTAPPPEPDVEPKVDPDVEPVTDVEPTLDDSGDTAVEKPKPPRPQMPEPRTTPQTKRSKKPKAK